jgi:hypothetical protein
MYSKFLPSSSARALGWLSRALVPAPPSPCPPQVVEEPTRVVVMPVLAFTTRKRCAAPR